MIHNPKFGSCGSENGASTQNHFGFLIFGAHPDGAMVAPPKNSKSFVLLSTCAIFILLNCRI
jgi:hypothetical protein